MKVRVTITVNAAEAPVGSKVLLVKQPDNAYDNEAIQVVVDGGVMGYVSAFYKTRKPNTISAGRLYDKVGDTVEAVMVEDQVAEIVLNNLPEDVEPEPDADMGRMEHDDKGDN